jgi:tetratricopeptide (TPR) repeat protein
MSLWKGKRVEAANLDLTQIEALLKTSIALDDTIADAHLQLGNLYAGQHHYDRAVPEYQRALALDPTVADAHYRLATGYTRLGDKARAQAEYALYQDLRSKHMAELDKERAEVQQFVYSSNAESPAPAKP